MRGGDKTSPRFTGSSSYGGGGIFFSGVYDCECVVVIALKVALVCGSGQGSGVW